MQREYKGSTKEIQRKFQSKTKGIQRKDKRNTAALQRKYKGNTKEIPSISATKQCLAGARIGSVNDNGFLQKT